MINSKDKIIENIKLNLGGTAHRLVVNGNISSDSIYQVIQLTRTSDYFADVKPVPVQNANVIVTIGTDTFRFIESPEHVDLYISEKKFRGIPGKIHMLFIPKLDIDSSGSKIDYYASTTMYPVNEIDSIRIELNTNDFGGGRGGSEKFKSYGIHMYAQEPQNAEQSFMFNLYKNDTLLTDTFNKRRYINSFRGAVRGYSNGDVVGRLSSRNPNENLIPGDIVTLEIMGIPANYVLFAQQADQQQGGSFPIFTGPPANVITNIYPKEKAVGYFLAYSSKRKSRFFFPLN